MLPARRTLKGLSNLPAPEWRITLGSITICPFEYSPTLIDRRGDSYRLKHSRQSAASQVSDDPVDS